MTDPHLFWFHCGRCGSLFQSHAGEEEKRLCPKCGFDPSPATGASTLETTAPYVPSNPESTDSRKQGKRVGKKRGNRYFMPKLIGGWSLVLILIILGARKIWHDAPAVKGPAPVTSKAAPKLTEEDVALINDAGPKCAGIFSGFLAAGTPEERNQFVLSPVTTASRMARFYSMNPLANIDPQTLELAERAILKLPGTRAIETQWNTREGIKLDAVFREENGEWRLDWDHFARYSDYPWALFLAGSGAPEGEFRLLARERLAEERKNSETISIVLYAPRFGHPNETGFQSPEFLVSRNKRDGQLLDAAFKLAKSRKQVFGSKLPDLNPDGMIRVRVKIKRTEVEMERKFEITEVTACHWYSVDEAGVEPLPPDSGKED